jgi:hypothetical protein
MVIMSAYTHNIYVICKSPDVYVRFWRIATHGLYTTLHNLIIVDFLHCLVATLYSF